MHSMNSKVTGLPCICFVRNIRPSALIVLLERIFSMLKRWFWLITILCHVTYLATITACDNSTEKSVTFLTFLVQLFEIVAVKSSCHETYKSVSDSLCSLLPAMGSADRVEVVPISQSSKSRMFHFVAWFESLCGWERWHVLFFSGKVRNSSTVHSSHV